MLARRDGVRQIAIVLVAFGAYELARIGIHPNWPVAMENARWVFELEQRLLLDFEDRVQAAFLAVPDVVEALNVFYFFGHFVLTGVFFVWLYRRTPDGYRVFRDGFLVATAISVLIHWKFPTAPPRLADVGLVDTLRVMSGIDIGSQTSTALSNPVAAVPSLHAGYAAGVGAGLLLHARRLPWRALGVVYPALVVLTIVVTGNHFVFDAIAGLGVMGIGFLLAARLRAALESRRGGAILAHATRGGAVR